MSSLSRVCTSSDGSVSWMLCVYSYMYQFRLYWYM